MMTLDFRCIERYAVNYGLRLDVDDNDGLHRRSGPTLCLVLCLNSFIGRLPDISNRTFLSLAVVSRARLGFLYDAGLESCS